MSPQYQQRGDFYLTLPGSFNMAGRPFCGHGHGELQRHQGLCSHRQIQRGDLVEVPMGNSLKDVIFDIAGGIGAAGAT